MGWRRWGKYKKTRGIPKIEEPTIWDHMLSHEKSFIYIMSSEANKDLLKIGKTERTPEERAKELSGSTSTPFPFRVEHYYCIPKELLNQTELNIHRQLKKVGKHASKEFFRLSIEEAKAHIEDVLKRMGILDIALGMQDEFNERVIEHNRKKQQEIDEKIRIKEREIKVQKDKEIALAAQEEKRRLEVRRNQTASDIRTVIENKIFYSRNSAKVLQVLLSIISFPSQVVAYLLDKIDPDKTLVEFIAALITVVVALSGFSCLIFAFLYLAEGESIKLEFLDFNFGLEPFTFGDYIHIYVRDYIFISPLFKFFLEPITLVHLCTIALFMAVLAKLLRVIWHENGGCGTFILLLIGYFLFDIIYMNNIGEAIVKFYGLPEPGAYLVRLVIAPIMIISVFLSIFFHVGILTRSMTQKFELKVTQNYKEIFYPKFELDSLGIKSSDIQVVVKAIEDGKTDFDRLKKGEIELYFPVLKNNLPNSSIQPR